MFLKVKHSEKYVNICDCLKAPRWHVLNVNIEWQMERWEKQMELSEAQRDHDLVSYLAKDVYRMKQELKHETITKNFN